MMGSVGSSPLMAVRSPLDCLPDVVVELHTETDHNYPQNMLWLFWFLKATTCPCF